MPGVDWAGVVVGELGRELGGCCRSMFVKAAFGNLRLLVWESRSEQLIVNCIQLLLRR